MIENERTYCRPTVLAAHCSFLATSAALLCASKGLLSIHPSGTVPATVAGHPSVVLLFFETLNEHGVAARVPCCPCCGSGGIFLVFAAFNHRRYDIVCIIKGYIARETSEEEL